MSTIDQAAASHQHLRPQDPEHRASARVRAVWSDVQHIDQAGMAFLSDVLRERLAGLIAPADDQVGVGQVTFTRFVRDSGRDSCAAYGQWRKQQADREELFSPRELRRIFGGPAGSWTVVKQTLGAAAVEDVTVARLLRACATSRSAVLIEAVRAYCSSVAAPHTEQGFVTWCSEQLQSPQPLVIGDLPRQAVQIHREFGSWPGLLRAASLDNEATVAEERLRVVELTTSEILELLREFADGRPIRKCHAGALDRWLKGLPDARFAPSRRPNSTWIEKKLGGLPRAFYLAGAFTVEDFANRLGGQLDLDDEVMLATLAAAITDEDPNPTRNTVDRWRTSMIARAAADGHLLLIPSTDTLCRRLGGRRWPNALRAVHEWLAGGGTPQAGVIRDDLLEQP